MENAPAWFAARIRGALQGAGTDDGRLLRVVTSRAEIDLGSIKREYERLYDKTLESDVAVSGRLSLHLDMLLGYICRWIFLFSLVILQRFKP